MSATGSAVLDFGVFPGATDASLVVTGQAGILAGSKVDAWLVPSATPALGYRAIVLADSPLGYWRLGESVGTIAAALNEMGQPPGDYTNMTLGLVGALSGDANAAARSSGNLGKVSIPSGAGGTPHLPETTTWSIELWGQRVVVNSVTEQILVSFACPGGSGNSGYNVTVTFIRAGGPIANVPDLDPSTGVSVRSVSRLRPVVDLDWHHYVVTHRYGFTSDSGFLVLYVDGEVEVAAQVTPALAGLNGGFQNMNVAYYNSALEGLTADEIAYYGYVLTQDQARAHYRAGLGMFPEAHAADEHALEPIAVYADTIVAGTGFTVRGSSRSQFADSQRPFGKYSVAWAWV